MDDHPVDCEPPLTIKLQKPRIELEPSRSPVDCESSLTTKRHWLTNHTSNERSPLLVVSHHSQSAVTTTRTTSTMDDHSVDCESSLTIKYGVADATASERRHQTRYWPDTCPDIKPIPASPRSAAYLRSEADSLTPTRVTGTITRLTGLHSEADSYTPTQPPTHRHNTNPTLNTNTTTHPHRHPHHATHQSQHTNPNPNPNTDTDARRNAPATQPASVRLMWKHE